jgi:hypothetical protein
LRAEWKAVTETAETKTSVEFIDEPDLRDAIRSSINHGQVSYRYCLSKSSAN